MFFFGGGNIFELYSKFKERIELKFKEIIELKFLEDLTNGKGDYRPPTSKYKKS